jgi:hypothetical protein
MGSGAAEGLQQVLQRLFLEAKLKQDQQEHMDRQGLAQQELGLRGRGLDIQEEGNRINAGMRDASLKATEAERLRQDEDRNAARGVQEQAALRGSLQMTPKGTPIDNPDTIVGMVKGHMGGMLKPVQNEPRFQFSGTQNAENVDANIKAREGALDERERHNREMEKLSATRAAWGPAPITIHTSDAQGNAVTKVVDRRGAAGQEFSAAPTTDTRNRQAAAQRITPVVEAIDELSTRINVNQGIAATAIGAADRQKAKVNLNDDISEYQGVVSGFTPMLARAVGHTGVLTQQDVDSVREALPTPEDSKSVRDRKITRFKSLLATGLPPGGTLSEALREDAAAAAQPNAQDLINKYRKE